MISCLQFSFVTATLLLTVASASAQGVLPGRPFRGLFGSDGSSWEQSLSVNGGLFGGFDTNLPAAIQERESDLGTLVPGSPQTDQRKTRGSYGSLSGSLSYSLQRTRIGLGASAGASARYYPDVVGSEISGSHSAVVGTSIRLTQNTELTAGQAAVYQRTGVQSLLPRIADPVLGELLPADHDFSADIHGYYAYQTNAGLSHRQPLSRRSSFAADYGYQLWTMPSEYGGFSSHNVSGRFVHEVARGLSLRLGYGLLEARYGRSENRRTRRHNIDTGFDYNRTLSFSRRTSLSFSTGAGAVEDGSVIRYSVIGTANLKHEIGRTWSLTVAYNRNAGFVQAFDAPFFVDAVNAGLTGLINRRLSFRSAFGLSLGDFGTPGSDESSTFATMSGSAGLNTALTRNLAISVDYIYYRYDFGQTELLPVGFLPETARHSIRAGLNVWAPLFNRGRRSDASR
jgi:opacity protein-like surface antigen